MPRQLRFGLHIPLADAFWVQVHEALLQEAKHASVTFVPSPVDLMGLATDTVLAPEIVAEVYDALLAEELDALICVSVPQQVSHILVKGGVPIIIMGESAIQHPFCASPIGLYDAAKMLIDYLTKAAENAQRLIVAGGLLSTGEAGRSRLAGLRDALGAYPEVRLDHIPTPWGYTNAYPYLERGMQKLGQQPDIIVGLSDSVALAARDVGRSLGIIGERTLIGGINGDPLALAAIADGSMAATVETSPLDLAQQVIALGVAAAHGEAIPQHFSLKPHLVTTTNVNEAMRRKLVAIANLPTYLIGVDREQEQKQLLQLRTGFEINRRIGTILDPEQMAYKVADMIRCEFGYDSAQVIHAPRNTQGFAPGETLADYETPAPSSALFGRVWTLNELVLVPDMQHSQRFPPDPDCPDTCTRLILPLRVGGEILALLDLHSRRVKHHTRQELSILQTIADQLGMAIRNAELYEEAVKAKADAEKADALKTRLLANVSHELRTPLNVILGYAESVLASPNPYGATLPDSLLHDFHHIHASAIHLMRLINDLLDLSRAEIGELDLVTEAFDAHTFLTELFHAFVNERAPRDQVIWQLQLPERLPVIEADAVRLRQVFLNLLANARKFTLRGHILLGAEVAPPHLHVWVEDTGPGIPADLQERIFEPFFSTPGQGRPPEGVGLGLTITRRLVALHGGILTLDSRPGNGSTFHVFLPLPNLSDRPFPPSGAPSFRDQGKSPLALVVSLRTHLPSACTDFLFSQGLDICHLRSGEQIASLLQLDRPLVLAWDLGNAVAGDWLLIEQIRVHPQWCQIPLLLYAVEQDQSPFHMIGAVTKPLKRDTLLEILRMLRPSHTEGPILVVDDDPQALNLYAHIAAEALPGYCIITADGGTSALQILETERPALVILDLIMPEVDGFAVLDHLRQQDALRKTPVLVVSGRVLAEDDIRRLERGRVAYQTKDVLTEEEIATGICQTMAGQVALPRSTSTLVKKAVAHIQAHYALPVTRQDIALAVGVSKGYLSEIFLDEVGLTPADYLLRYRLSRAKVLLRETDISITEVAGQVGFDDPSHFSRVFSKHMGCSPRAYREFPDPPQ